MIRIVKGVVGSLIVAGGVFAATRPLGSLPPLGPLIVPSRGVWALPRAGAPLGDRRMSLPMFEDQVQVVVDDRGVPHIYAANEADLYRALGYLVARDRLFQLDLQTRAAAGTLTELLGPRALPLDREARRFGFGRVIERAVRADTAAPEFRVLRWYAEGINGWIDGMGPEDLPLEYRLLGRRPVKWLPENSYYLLARMALTLAYGDPALLKERAAARVGRAAADALFPVNSVIQEPIQPNPVDSTKYVFAPLPAPGAGDSTAKAAAATGLAAALGRSARLGGIDAVGSNNWAVSPRRSATGHALLAGDPHLELTLPSIWYQAHLVVPGRLDVAGVTLPGAPWVVIGFNRSIAWSLTNTGADVADVYRETVDDAVAPSRYQVDGNWKTLDRRIEVYWSPRGEPLAIDTIRFTHRGPLWRSDSTWVSLAWTVYEGRNSGREFLRMNKAGSVGEFLEAGASYAVPAQNMIVADRQGSIAIRSTGRYPIRPGGRGDWIQDGSTAAGDWTGNVPLDAYPFAINPARGFLSSANQQPVDPAANPRYLGADWPNPWRAIRINTLLRRDSAVTPEAMRRYQTDPGSARVDAFMPWLTLARKSHEPGGKTAARAAEARTLLLAWDRRYDLNNTGAVLFEAVMRELAQRTWDELAAAPPDSSPPLRPGDPLLLGLLRDSASGWWDDRRTTPVEHEVDIVEQALAAGLDSVQAKFGAPGGAGWKWSEAHHANIYHLLRLPALSALGLSVPSGPSTLSPSGGNGTHGASWRMVVELGPEVTAWGIYPGGQSGNPVSSHYRDQISRWQSGRLDSLVVPKTAEAFPADRVESRVTFSPRK